MLKEYHIVTKPRKFSSSSLVRIKSSEKRDCEKNCVIVSHFFRTNSVQSAVLQATFSQPPDKRCSKACICGNKPNQTKNIRSYFYLAVLIT
ncbi:hypothetical protein B1P92_14055 [Enterococcus faecium]|nr:hypothetical protein B1P92_14055 [Enterococcus faecium]